MRNHPYLICTYNIYTRNKKLGMHQDMIAVELKLILNIPIRLVAIYWGNAVGQHGGNSVKHFQIFPMRRSQQICNVV